ncbi:type II secretion system F family protein [Actinopolymorpha sp. B9G3]|uniref:type II secretion system F family protein n=1 Tax=Actinopolymorpha sp. B9G3 TaxID=3158970 RepID=UPI0032D94280
MSVAGWWCLALAAAAGALLVPDRSAEVLLRRILPPADQGQSVMVRIWERARSRFGRVGGDRRDIEERRALVREACEVIATELRVGRAPVAALEAAADTCPALAPVVAVSRMGGDVPTSLRSIRLPGAEGLTRLAAAWTVAAATGAGLADVLDRVSAGLRDDDALRDEVAAQLAAPRASARLLAALPLLGLALGVGAGADPIGFLARSPYGLVCLVMGSALAVTGVSWVNRLARHAEPLP